MPRRPKDPSGKWLSFIRNHMDVPWAMDFCFVRTIDRIQVLLLENHRLHQGLGGKCPKQKPEKPSQINDGKIISIPVLGGLHHRYERVAA